MRRIQRSRRIPQHEIAPHAHHALDGAFGREQRVPDADDVAGGDAAAAAEGFGD